MFAFSRPPAARIDACARDLAALTAAWRAVARRCEPAARAAAEAQVFNQMAVALEGWFRRDPHRESDGDAVQEVRLLAQGVTANGGYFPTDHAIRWRPEGSITGYRAGDPIRLTEEVFSRLAAAYLAAMGAMTAPA